MSVAQDRELTLAEQSALFIQINSGLNAESREDAITLLRLTTTSRAQVLKSGDNSLWICVEDGKVLLVAAFNRWTSAEAKRLMAMGWEEAGKGMRSAAATALGVMGIATYGLGFGLLMNKKTRDYVTTRIAVKRFPLSTPGEAAMSIVETFRVLAPAARTVACSKSTAPHP